MPHSLKKVTSFGLPRQGDIPLSPVMISPSRSTVLPEIFIVLLFLLTALREPLSELGYKKVFENRAAHCTKTTARADHRHGAGGKHRIQAELSVADSFSAMSACSIRVSSADTFELYWICRLRLLALDQSAFRYGFLVF